MPARSPQAAAILTEGFLRLYPDEGAQVLERCPAAEVGRALEGVPAATAAGVFDRLTPDLAAQVLDRLAEARARDLLTALDPARTATLLARFDTEARRRRLSLLDRALAREIEGLIAYPPDSAGRLMDPRVTALRPGTTVAEALDRLRPLRAQRIQEVFLVDGGGRLVGAVSLQDLALAPPPARLEALGRGAPPSVPSMATREDVLERLEQSRLTTLPVLDLDERLLGVIRHDALVTAAREEASVDIQTMVGASREERALSPVSFAVRKRLPWLQVNLATAFLAAAVVGLFEDTIARFTALAVLLPVVAGQSGNTGAQALAVTMRGLALREIRVRHWLRVSGKEINVAVINGVAVALTTALGVYVWSRSPGLALVICLSMVISMVAAGLSGAAIPMVLSALGQDPAQSSSIILTTVTDVVGFFSFLGIATLLAGLL
jgi:magnesium transporter